MAEQSVLFDERFLERHAGSIITSAAVAIVELVANAWDAYATRVDITWPDVATNTPFAICDDGCGLTREQFERRWSTLDYNRLVDQGDKAELPGDIPNLPERAAFGRNGRGRHAALKFSDPYHVTTWRDGQESVFRVRRDVRSAFSVELQGTKEVPAGHGTRIAGDTIIPANLSSEDAREVLGSRFLADPNFVVTVDGIKITFDDIPKHFLSKRTIEVPGHGSVDVYVIDVQKADRTTKQHGVAWRVKSRLVGSVSWSGFNDERILDGRTNEAKRLLVIVMADFLEGAVLPDWSSFKPTDPIWEATRSAVHGAIQQVLNGFTEERRAEKKAGVRQNLQRSVRRLSPVDRERWEMFVDRVVDACPSINATEVEQVASILANLELSQSQYGLLEKLDSLKPDELDALNKLLEEWTLRSAKIALDEIQNRLKLIAELDVKLNDPKLEEVAHLQPLFERSLWVFGPEFESIEFTSNKGMTTAIQHLFGVKETGSLRRPDFVVLPDGAASFFSRDSYDEMHEVNGPAVVVIVEIKKVGVEIGEQEKGQPWRYVREFLSKGIIKDKTRVHCFVLGSKIDPTEVGETTHLNGRVVVRSLGYENFIKRAEARMLGLRRSLQDVPFLQDLGFDSKAYITPEEVDQTELSF